MNARRPITAYAFTLMELLVAMGVLALIVALSTQLFDGARKVTEIGGKQMDADAQARAVFDRMALDFAQMVKRPDVDYFLKDSAHPQPGNDQIAFYSQVPGYPDSGSHSPVSLVGYRTGTDGRLQRLGCGLPWNGSSTSGQPMVFLPLTIADTWPSATNLDADDNYELAGPQVFRMEYYYVIKGSASNPSVLSGIPWDARPPASHASVDGLRDVAAIGVVIAVIDSKSRNLVSDDQLNKLAQQLSDFPETDANGDNSSQPGELEAEWQKAINASGLPPSVTSSIRIYRRWFSFASDTSPTNL